MPNNEATIKVIGAGFLIALSFSSCGDDKRKEVAAFSEKCLAEHHGDGDLCGVIWRAGHPVGRGY